MQSRGSRLLPPIAIDPLGQELLRLPALPAALAFALATAFPFALGFAFGAIALNGIRSNSPEVDA